MASKEPSSFAEERRKIKETESFKKALNYIEALIHQKDFQDKVLEIRGRYGIPDKGLAEIKLVPSEFQKDVQLVQIPSELDTFDMREEARLLAQGCGLDVMWTGIFLHYVIYNSIEIHTLGDAFDVVDLQSFTEPEAGPWWDEIITEEGKDYSEDHYREMQKQLRDTAKTHPIALLIHPYASQRDIIDYVKKLFKHKIQPLQERYKDPKISLGKVRTKNQVVKQRNKFIFQNRNLPKKQITQLVAEKFGDILDYTYINKIITDEEKKISEHR